MVRTSRKIEKRRTVSSPVLVVCETGTFEVVVFGCVIPGSRRILLGDRMGVKIQNDRRGEELESQE